MTVSILPAVNASLNALAGICLIFGYYAIKRKDERRHRFFMLSALTASSLFLGSYITYHILVPGVTRYEGNGIWRPIYFFILLTHTPLATLIVTFSLAALWQAYKRNFKKHVRITRWLFPVWLYVSVTGVVIYLMLYVFKPIPASG